MTDVPLRDLALGLVRPSADNLECHPLAIQLLSRYQAATDLLDEIAGWFLDQAERRGRLFGFEFLLYATSVAQIGGSAAVLERTLELLTRYGFPNHALKLARRLGRRLTADEVLTLIQAYTTGGSSSSESDCQHQQLAREYLDPAGLERAKQLFAERTHRWASDPL